MFLGYGLHCYVCNSSEDEACGDPFDEDAAKSSNLWKNCSNPAEADPMSEKLGRRPKTVYWDNQTGNYSRISYSFCRKTTQKSNVFSMIKIVCKLFASYCKIEILPAALVGMKEEETRIIRTCGYLHDPKLMPEEGVSDKNADILAN